MNKLSFVVASDVNPRDGNDVELYLNNKIKLEVFRDDTTRRRYVPLFSNDVDLELVEQWTQEFKDKNLWDFTDY